MNLTVSNDGPSAVRVIVDHDNVHDFTLAPGDTQTYDTPPAGIIEFRELDGNLGDFAGVEQHP